MTERTINMNDFDLPSLPHLPFARIYESNIEPKLKEIDLFLKTASIPYNPNDVSELLHIQLSDLNSIMKKEGISELNLLSFFTIVHASSSYICQLIQREWKCNHVQYYTPEIISYIYELNQDKVTAAVKKSGLSQVEAHNIKELFEYIDVPMMNF